MARLLFSWIIAPIAIFALGFGAGWRVHDWRDAAQAVHQIQHVVTVTQKQGSVNTEIAVKQQAAQDRIVYQTKVIHDEIPKYITVHDVADCTVNVGALRVLNAAASGLDVSAVSDPAGRPDDAASGVGLDTVAATVTLNYGSARGAAEQLKNLQAWVREQQAASR